jgi:hypothetical protein
VLFMTCRSGSQSCDLRPLGLASARTIAAASASGAGGAAFGATADDDWHSHHASSSRALVPHTGSPAATAPPFDNARAQSQASQDIVLHAAGCVEPVAAVQRLRNPQARGSSVEPGEGSHPLGADLRQPGLAQEALAAVAAAGHAAGALAIALSHDAEGTYAGTTTLLPSLLTAMATLLPAAADVPSGETTTDAAAVAAAAATAAVDVARALTALCGAVRPPASDLRGALAKASKDSRCDLCCALAAALRPESPVPASVLVALCGSIAALLSSPQHAEAVLVDTARSEERAAPRIAQWRHDCDAAESEEGCDQVGSALLRGALWLLGRLSAASTAAERRDTSSPARRGVLEPRSPNIASQHIAAARVPLDVPPDTADGRAVLGTLRAVLAHSMSAKEHALSRGMHVAWAAQVSASCEVLAGSAAPVTGVRPNTT